MVITEAFQGRDYFFVTFVQLVHNEALCDRSSAPVIILIKPSVLDKHGLDFCLNFK